MYLRAITCINGQGIRTKLTPFHSVHLASKQLQHRYLLSVPDKTEDLVLSVTWFFSTWGAALSENADTICIVFYAIAEKVLCVPFFCCGEKK